MEMVMDLVELSGSFQALGMLEALTGIGIWEGPPIISHVCQLITTVVDLAVEHAHSLGESRLATVADQFMDGIFWFSWYGISTWHHCWKYY